MKTEVAELGDFVAVAAGGAAWATVSAGEATAIAKAIADITRKFRGTFMATSEFPQPFALTGQKVAFAALVFQPGLATSAEQARKHIPEISARL